MESERNVTIMLSISRRSTDKATANDDCTCPPPIQICALNFAFPTTEQIKPKARPFSPAVL